MWRVSNMLAVPTVFSRENHPRAKQTFRARVWLLLVTRPFCWNDRNDTGIWVISYHYSRLLNVKSRFQCLRVWLQKFLVNVGEVTGCCRSKPAFCCLFHCDNKIHLFAKATHSHRLVAVCFFAWHCKRISTPGADRMNRMEIKLGK